MKRLPFVLSAVFLAITLARVARFSAEQMQAGALGWLFAAGLGLATFTGSYFARYKATRKQALAGLVFFVAIDAYLNFADVWLVADTTEPLVAIGAVLYGLFPTIAVALLGWLAGAIRSLPPEPKRTGFGVRGLIDRLANWIDDRTHEPEQAKPEPVLYVCPSPGCGWTTSKSQLALRGHMRKHTEKRSNGHKKLPEIAS